MKTETVERLKREIQFEFSRKGPPVGFPAFDDIPGGRYVSKEYFDLEMEHLWPRLWMMGARAEELPAPGHYVTWDSSPYPIVFVSDDTGTIRAFLNESPAGAPLTPFHDDSHLHHEVKFDAPGQLFLQHEFPRRTLPGGLLECRRTGRRYDTRGRLVHVPAPYTLEGIKRADRQLTEFRCEIFDGWVFVNRDPDAMDLISWLGPVAEEMAMFQGAKMRTFQRATVVQHCNWKVANEAFQEVYHFKHIHQHDGVTLLDQRGATMGLLPEGHSRMVTPYTKRMCDQIGMEDPTDWRDFPAMGGLAPSGTPDIETVIPMVRLTSTALNIFPNLITPVSSQGFPFIFSWPIDVDTTLHEWITYVPDWGEDTERIEAQRQASLAMPQILMEEDIRNMDPMHKSLESPGLVGIPLSYQERRIYHTIETIDRYIGVENIPEALRVRHVLEPYIER